MFRPASATVLSTLVVAALSGCALLGPTEADVAELQLAKGDCIASLEELSAIPEGETGEVGALPTVDCSEEHEAEVYYAADSTAAEYSATILEDAEALCMEEFAAFVGLPYDESRLYMFQTAPTQATWDAGDRQIVCLVAGDEGEMFTATLEDSRL